MARMFSLITTLMLNLIMRPALVGAGASLRGRLSGGLSAHKSNDDLGKEFLSEIENVLGSDHSASIQKRLSPMEVMLRPTLGALPRDEQGRYGHMAVRHALHRLFVKKHGWYIKGLDTSGESSPGASFADNLPEYLQGLFEARLGSHGLTAHEVALLAAVLENLVHREAMQHLDQAYEVQGMSTNESGMAVEKVDSLIDTYMAMKILSYDAATLKRKSPHPAKYLHRAIEYQYDGWQAVRSFARDVREEASGERTSFGYAEVLEVIERIADQYGRWQNRECEALKLQLLKIEDSGNGRVTLANFYNASLTEDAPFNETRDFLRQMGVLDETEMDNPRVLVANYVLSGINCLGESAYYNQCCINECENLVEHLEREIKSPDATPERIVEVIPSLSLSKRRLEPKLLQRLQAIADNNGGRVILHSRLFAQWIHYVFPRECPYPQVWKDARPMDRSDYEKATGRKTSTPLKEMRAFVEASQHRLSQAPSAEAWDELSLWSHEEELYAHASPPQAGRSADRPSRLGVFARRIAFVVVLGILGLKLSAFVAKPSSTWNGQDITDVFGSGKRKFV
eukprot:TRINITY_DN2028_c0_g1_i8.p1 TRINITY_DN2028_c0_g1~~TRINITY_DN2028_c0_g1_i8.p1  ORF type:complete len:569 (+),score=113.78 TRINITY_DN2028_c0_g1_i8:99-1805(+)